MKSKKRLSEYIAVLRLYRDQGGAADDRGAVCSGSKGKGAFESSGREVSAISGDREEHSAAVKRVAVGDKGGPLTNG